MYVYHILACGSVCVLIILQLPDNVNNKIRLYKILIKPVLCCGSVTWTLPTPEQVLNMFERKILRRICGPTQEKGCWRPRWNNEIYSLYNEPNIVEDIKIRRLGWAGHIIRMEEETIPEKVLNGNFRTTRPVGRRTGRMWFRGMHCNCWEEMRRAANKDEWRCLMREAKA
jgi:hypothetical protein